MPKAGSLRSGLLLWGAGGSWVLEGPPHPAESPAPASASAGAVGVGVCRSLEAESPHLVPLLAPAWLSSLSTTPESCLEEESKAQRGKENLG